MKIYKAVVPALFVLTSFNLAHAGAKRIIKSCDTTMATLDNPEIKVDIGVNIYLEAGGKITGAVNKFGMTGGIMPVVVESGEIRANLPKVPGPMDDVSDELADELDSLSNLERTIAHAKSLINEPMFEGMFSLDMNLSKAASGTIYTLIEEGVNIGQTSIVEVKDKDGKVLGSFLGGFLIGQCK